jgi:hypothetical protein
MMTLTPLVAAGLMMVLAAATPAGAQKSTLPESVTKPSTQRPMITKQLELAVAEERRALSVFDQAASDEDIAVGHQAASNAYVLIRAAREGIFRIKGLNSMHKRPEDPMLEIAFKKVTAAWNRSRAPVDRLHNAGRRADYLETSRRQLAETIAMLEELLVIWM